MPYPVRYSPRAYAEYEEILTYIAEKFGIEIALRVDAYFEDIIENISLIHICSRIPIKRRI